MIQRRTLGLLHDDLLHTIKGDSYNRAYREAVRGDNRKKRIPLPGLSRKERKQLIREGFLPDKSVWYDFKKYDKKDYITDLNHYRDYEQIDRKFYYVAHNKLVCERFFRGVCPVIPSIAYIDGGCFFSLEDSPIRSFEDLAHAVLNGTDYYLKPYDGGSGLGVGRLSFADGDFQWNGEKIDDIKTFFHGLSGYIVQERFHQTGYSHDVNPDTLNTLRVLTMQDPETRQPFLPAAIHRIGRAGMYVDNVAKASMICPIDVNTGVIQYAAIYPSDGVLRKVDNHPDTGVPIAGQVLPNWEKVKETCLRLASQVPFMPLCGWDIIVSGDEVYMQELNYNPDIYLNQVLSPLLLDPRVKRFHEYYCNRK